MNSAAVATSINVPTIPYSSIASTLITSFHLVGLNGKYGPLLNVSLFQLLITSIDKKTVFLKS